MTDRRWLVAAAGALALFLAVQLGALALVDPFEAAGYRAVEDPQDPVNSVVYLLAILAATGVMLAAFRLGVDRMVQMLVIASAALISLYVFSVLVPPVVTVSAGGTSVNLGAVGAAGILAVALLVHPEWYVIDAAGVVMGAGAAALFGISFGLLPALVLLVALAVYDAISVYGTEHMLTLASGVMDLKVPVVLVIPLSISYSYLDAETPQPGTDEATDATGEETAMGEESGEATESSADDGEAFEREAFFVGLGDAVIPTVLVASAALFAPTTVPVLGGLGLTVAATALGALVGTMAGLVVLLWLVGRGRPHAGLPLLNGGAIAGYLVVALASGVDLWTAVGL